MIRQVNIEDMNDKWNEIHSRLEKVRVLIERGFEPTPEKKKSILKNRAGTLAREPNTPDKNEVCLIIMEFMLSGEKYAFESSYIREVLPLKDLTPLPCTPPFVMGIINVRGQILSVLDIRNIFGLPENNTNNHNKVVVLHTGDMEIGILAEVILGTRSVFQGQVVASLPTLNGIRAEYLRGVTSDRTAILDAARLLSDRKMIVQGEF